MMAGLRQEESAGRCSGLRRYCPAATLSVWSGRWIVAAFLRLTESMLANFVALLPFFDMLGLQGIIG